METPTINEIKQIKDTLITNIEVYKTSMKSEPNIDLNTPQFGRESEYSINGLIAGVKNILTDVSFLVRSHAFFIKISTYDERTNLKNNLSNLNSYISNKQHANIATTVDTLKTNLRPYNLRLDKDRFLDFNSEIDILRRKSIELEGDITLVKQKIEESSSVYSEITEKKDSFEEILSNIITQKDDLEKQVEEFTEKYEDFTSLATKAESNELTIATKLGEILESEEKFNEFNEKIDSREKQLIAQSEKFSTYDKAISDYKSDQDQLIKTAMDLIDKSKLALQYTTAVGLSTAFSNQYDDANKNTKTIPWLVGAGFFIIITLLIGIWILTGWGIDSQADKLIKIIGRLSLIPFTLLGALFCANQYIKQKNLIEDYAYKSVLAKSIIAFSEELRDRDAERYAEYISTVLKEIHQDPLRKRGKEDKKDEVNLHDAIGSLSKIIELLKPIMKN